ncbi:MAG: DNA primase [Phycisphaerales bacterium]|nr:DNA primase [Phycisphaerales bacterium]
MSNSLRDKVLEAVDVVDVIGESVALKRRGKEFIGLCPFHADRNPSMSVSPTKQIFKCWACGAGGDAIRFVQLRDRVDFPEALRTLATRAGLQVRGEKISAADSDRREAIRAVMEWARSQFERNLTEHPHGRLAMDYARRRGLSEDTIRRFRAGYALNDWDSLLNAANAAGVSTDLLLEAGLVTRNEEGRTYDRFRNRLIFPICDPQGRPVAFGGRTLGDDPAKYLNSPETPLFSKSRVLFGLDAAKSAISAEKSAIVVEGYMDAVLLSQYGVQNVVATMGTALTDAHAKLLRPLAERVFLCFDGDEAGIKAADRAVETALRSRLDVRVVMMPDETDPADCVVNGGTQAFTAQLQSSLDALEFKWSQVRNSFADKGPQSKKAAAEQFIAFIGSVSSAGGIDPIDQGLLVGRLSDLLAMPVASIYDLLGRAMNSRRTPEQATDDFSDEISDYAGEVRALPAAFVASVESLLGMLADSSAFYGALDDRYALAVAQAETWRRLDAVYQELYNESGVWTRSDVLQRCEDGASCELVNRCLAIVAGVDSVEEHFSAIHARLEREIADMQLGELQAQLRSRDSVAGDSDQAFRALLETAGRQHALLPGQARWSVGGGPSRPTPA